VAVSKRAIAAALREAFEARRAQKSKEVEAAMAAFLDGMLEADEAARHEPLSISTQR
jgi:hypothetical protein